MTWFSRILQKHAFPAMDRSIPLISPQEAAQTCDMNIGPIYHGSTAESINDIRSNGFKWEEGEARTTGTSHGYMNSDYAHGCPPPVHHLGYGIYFTQNKSIAKDYGYGSMRNVMEVYILKGSRYADINFGAPNTMMKWWNANGYDCNLAKIDRIAATKALTAQLASRYDAVLFRGKGLRRLLDGNQLCVYNPSILRQIDKSMAQSGEIGSKVVRKIDGMKGTLINRRPLEEQFRQYHDGATELLVVKWQVGGTDSNVRPQDINFV